MSIEDKISIEIFLPTIQFSHTPNGSTVADTSWNQYCWVSKMEIDVKQVGYDTDDQATDEDIIYENVIDSDAVQELPEITVKFTTADTHLRPAYSNVMLDGKLLGNIYDSTSGTIGVPEEHIIERYVSQYSTPTRKLSLGCNWHVSRALPACALCTIGTFENGVMWKPVGQELDFKTGWDNITFIEFKTN